MQQTHPLSKATMKPGIKAMLAAAALLVALGGLQIAVAQQDMCPHDTLCGLFCCPETREDRNSEKTACCDAKQGCCTQNFTAPQCGVQRCPTSLNPDEWYDSDNLLRNQCCIYFRDGCCSENENQTLDLLFKVSIGIGVAVFILLCIVAVLLVCCCYVFWRR